MQVAPIILPLILGLTLCAIARGTGFDIVEVAPGVHVAVRTEPPGLTANANCVFIINDEDVVVVDSTLTPSTATEALAALRKLTDKPVKFVINTHWHDDHILGNQVYRDAFPGVEFIAHERTRGYLLGPGLENRKQAMSESGYPQFITFLRSMLDNDRNMSGRKLSEEEREAFASDIKIAERFMAEAPGAQVVLPTKTLTDELVLQRGSRTIRILHLGRGHTSGDVVVHVPNEGVVIAGDLVIAPVPYVGADQSHIVDWAATLRKLLALKAKTIVPGHGKVLRDDTHVKRMIELFEFIAKAVNEGVARGETLEQIRKSIQLKQFEEMFAGQGAVRKAIFRNYVTGPAIESAFNDAKEEKNKRARMRAKPQKL